MARFVVYANRQGSGYLLDVQANLLEHLTTCVVVPLLPVHAAPKPAKVLNPIFEVEGQLCVLVTQFLAAVPKGIMGAEVLNLRDESGVIVNALDCLFQGL